MLYAHSTQKFQKLSKTLEDYKIEIGIIDIALEYLDISKTRNNALLDRIPVQPYVSDWTKKNNLANAVKREIISTKNPELLERYILLCQALWGSYSGESIDFICGWNGIIKYKNKITTALSSRYADKAEACYYAIFMMYYQENNYFWKNSTDNYKSPQICIDAVDFADDELVKCRLCAMALNQTELPEKKNIISKLISKQETNPVVEKALEYINNIVSSSPKLGREILLAIGEGAYFSSELKEYFMSKIKLYCNTVANYAMAKLPDPSRILNLIAEVPDCIQPSYINQFFNVSDLDNVNLSAYFEVLAAKYTDKYVNAMNSVTDAMQAKKMEEILLKVNPDYVAKQYSLKKKAQLRIAKSLSGRFKNNTEVYKYLVGELSFADIKDLIDVSNGGNWSNINYTEAYGIDDFVKRSITVITVMDSYNTYYCLRNSFDFKIDDNPDQYIELLIEQGVDSDLILERLGKIIDDSYVGEKLNLAMSKAVADRAEYFADTDVTKMSVTSRWIYVTALATADRNKYKSQIMAIAGDTSKKIKEVLTVAVSADWHDDIVKLLTAKKSGLRELAISVIEKNNNGTFEEELKTAFEKEKSEKLKTRLAVLIGAINPENSVSEQATGIDVVSGLAKGAKAKKVAWLFEQPYKTVRFSDGGEVPEDYLKTLIILYSDMPSIAINSTAVEIAGKIDPYDLNNFTVEVFRRWANKGATAKTKWVMWFCGVHGGHGMIETLMKYIKEWSEHSRGAIASEAVYAMAVNGSSEALMNVDSIARKFKHRQVRNAANDALVKASEILGITKEELSDRIVPDMGFNDEMCRVFDYGKRQFNVYLTPTLEIEIYNGDKKVKNMPKVGANDNKEIAEKSYNDFKVMKKQIKTVVENQKQRLEYVLMCDRKWTCDNWKKLFVKNPVMHCFAIGLIWGIYNGSELIESFRYMDDGSFTNIDEDEFELPENAEIGLVHPIELTDEQKASWAEQLSDYEITQPFNQLGRPCYKPTEKELNDDEITRFESVSVGNYTLRGKLTKQGWETGTPMDGGWFHEFVRNDVLKCVKNSDGVTVYEGYHTEIEFDGMGIDYMEAEDVNLGKLIFKNYNAGYNDKNLKIKDVNPRYFSEIIMQLTALGNVADNTEV